MQVRMAPAAVTGSSPRATPVVRTSARSRPWSPGSTPGDGDGPHVGRPGRGHRVEPLGDASGPHVGAVPGVLTRSSPWATPAIRTSARSRA